MLRRLFVCLFMLCFITIPSIEAQILPAVLLEDFEGQAVPHTSSGLINRLISAVMSEFSLEGSSEMFLDDSAGESRFQVEISLDDAMSVSFYTGESTHEAGFYIYQQIASEEAPDFETFQRLINLVDEAISEGELQEAYDRWLDEPEEKQNFILGDHMVYTEVNEITGKELMTFEVMYEYDNTVFEEDAVQNMVTTFYDDSKEFPNIYAQDYANNQEEVYVNRVFINRILHELSRTFGFEISTDHLSAMGNTVYYYSAELAEFGRINEFYIFSGRSGNQSRLEIRFTLGQNEWGSANIRYLEDQRRSFFYYFAKLLDPELTDLEVEQAFLDTLYEAHEEYRLGKLIIQKEGFTNETISMARVLNLNEIDAVFPESIQSVSKQQKNRVLLAEDTYHVASVEQLANPEKIYASYAPFTRLTSGSGSSRKEFDELSQSFWDKLPEYKTLMSFTGEVVSTKPEENLLEVKPAGEDFFETFYVYTPEANLEISGIIEVTGVSLGMQHSGAPNLSLLAQRIQQEGQLIYQAGGGQDE